MKMNSAHGPQTSFFTLNLDGQSAPAQIKASLVSIAEAPRLAELAELAEVPRDLGTWAGNEQKSCHTRYLGFLSWLSWLGYLGI